MNEKDAKRILGDEPNHITCVEYNGLPDLIRVFGYAPQGEEAPPKKEFAGVIELQEDVVFTFGRAANADLPNVCIREQPVLAHSRHPEEKRR